MTQPPLPLSGYVLAGGRSSRMGVDKALLELGGKTLAARAVETLTRVCERVSIAGAAQMQLIAPAVTDRFAGRGPLGGIEAALRDTQHDWSMFLPVDLPFVPHDLLYQWVRWELQRGDEAMRICYFEAEQRPQPLVCLLHRSVHPWIEESLRREAYKVRQVFDKIAEELAPALLVEPSRIVQRVVLGDDARLQQDGGEMIVWTATAEEAALRRLWFANLNTPEEFAYAEGCLRYAEANLAFVKASLSG